MTSTEQSRAALTHWYNHMWGRVDFDLIPEIAAPRYLRHDITGANNLMPAEAYRDMLKPALGHLKVESFTYHLTCEEGYVGALGRFILSGDRQWDWVQLFRVEDHRLAETWLAGMGGTDRNGYPHPRNTWTGTEIPTTTLSETDPKRAVRAWLQSLADQQTTSGSLAETVRVHDQFSRDREMSATELQGHMLKLMHTQSVQDFHHFLIAEGDMVYATCSWKLDGNRQWDWLQAFQMEDGKVRRTWLPVIGGTDTQLKVGPETRWAAHALPAGSVVL